MEQVPQAGLRTVAFHQASFGTPYTQPTRLLLKTPLSLPDFVYEGPATFTDNGTYTEPLPPGSCLGSLLQRQATGAFEPPALSMQWPARLCQWLAGLLVDTCMEPASTATVEEGDQASERPSRNSG